LTDKKLKTMSQVFRDVELEIDELANFMFKRNDNNVVLELSLGGIENNKDLFYFILDLFCKGLVMMFGNETNSVDVDTITFDNFLSIKEKMLCAGIQVNMEHYPNDIPLNDENMSKRAIINTDEINEAEDNKPLNEYIFKLYSLKNQYIISFSLIHRVLG
jgi:hypothetical protein